MSGPAAWPGTRTDRSPREHRFTNSPVCSMCVAATLRSQVVFGMNRFDREYWDGAREMALMFFDSMRVGKDVPDDLKKLAETALRETGERKNRDFREAIGVVHATASRDPSSKQGA